MTDSWITWAQILETWFKMSYFFFSHFFPPFSGPLLFNLLCLQFLDNLHFYLPLDNGFVMDHFKSDVETLSHHWRMLGRPIIIFPVNRSMLGAIEMAAIGFVPVTLSLYSLLTAAYNSFPFYG